MVIDLQEVGFTKQLLMSSPAQAAGSFLGARTPRDVRQDYRLGR
jgi:hypothetical protein